MINKRDFVSIDYAGKLEEGTIFDTTDEKLAKENELQAAPRTTICIGEGMILQGIDDQLIGKKEGTYTLTIAPEDAFGKKNAKLIQLIPSGRFTDQKIEPQVGLQLNIDGIMGIIRNVSGGRVLVDFNHPLSGRTVVYEVTVHEIVKDQQKKVEALATALGGSARKDGDKYVIQTQHELDAKSKDELTKKFKELCEVAAVFETVKTPADTSAKTKPHPAKASEDKDPKAQ